MILGLETNRAASFSRITGKRCCSWRQLYLRAGWAFDLQLENPRFQGTSKLTRGPALGLVSGHCHPFRLV
jgi:hypothetical protein